MKLENQVCSFEQAKILKELGVDYSKSIFVYIDNKVLGFEGIQLSSSTLSQKHFHEIKDRGIIKFYSAFTVGELGLMIGSGYGSGISGSSYTFKKNGAVSGGFSSFEDNEAKERADNLISFLTHGIMTVEEINQRITEASA